MDSCIYCRKNLLLGLLARGILLCTEVFGEKKPREKERTGWKLCGVCLCMNPL